MVLWRRELPCARPAGSRAYFRARPGPAGGPAVAVPVRVVFSFQMTKAVAGLGDPEPSLGSDAEAVRTEAGEPSTIQSVARHGKIRGNTLGDVDSHSELIRPRR